MKATLLFIPDRMAIIKNNSGKVVGKEKPLFTFNRCVNWNNHYRN